jgi:CheY-like chemotaxis protein
MATRRRNRKSKPPVVLVVEDEPTIRALAVSIIEDNLGWRTLSAADAREAIALLEEGPDASFLFTDIELPGSAPPRDGFELARAAARLWRCRDHLHGYASARAWATRPPAAKSIGDRRDIADAEHLVGII